MSWTDARRYCEERGGYLATITSSGEQTFIENLLARAGDKSVYWLGGYCGNDGRMEDKIEITRVAAPYTSNSRPGHWNDAPTNSNIWKGSYDYYVQDLGFICEFDS
jgi:hypothetical protein